MTEREIFDALVKAGMTKAGAAGLMGNLQAESGLVSTNLQNAYNTKLGMTDEQYTAAVDKGSYTNFVKDVAGYGLAQWTYWSRKQNLLTYARGKKVSIGDALMQVEFLIMEIKTAYQSVWKVLTKTSSVREASDCVLTQFERPADMSERVKVKRAEYGQDFYNRLAGTPSGQAAASAVNYNSSLVDIVGLSPTTWGKKTGPTDIIIPHCAVGQWTAERAIEVFRPKERRASCTYAIGKDGRVALIVPEDTGSCCTSTRTYDLRAVTIECASDNFAPYAFNDTVYRKLADLCVDICQRHGRKKLLWISDKAKALAYNTGTDTMLLMVHRWFENKACPGDWMYSRMGTLSEEVTKRLGGTVSGKDVGSGAAISGGSVAAKPAAEANGQFRVRVSVTNLNIRTGPGIEYSKAGVCSNGIFTITEVKPGEGSSSGWGKLKSGAGWISLDHAARV